MEQLRDPLGLIVRRFVLVMLLIAVIAFLLSLRKELKNDDSEKDPTPAVTQTR